MLARVAFVVTVLVGCGSSPTGPIAAHVTHYDFTFDVDSRAAHASVTAIVDTEGDCWTLPFRAAAPANVRLGGKPAKPVTADATSVTACGAGVAAGKPIVLDLDTTFAMATLGPSQVGYSITMDAQQNPFYYLVSWVGGCDNFSPCDNRPDQFATYHFDVTHPASLAVRCPGTITEVSPTETTCAFDHDGGPTYSTFGVAAYPAWTQTDEGTWGAAAHVTVYDRAQTGIVALIDPAYHGGFIAWMEQTFGPYPYGTELRILTAPTYWNGFEHPGNIVLNDTLATQKNSGYAHTVAHTLDHEMTHMWAGDQTTLADQYDFAWKEAMAEYLSYVWEDMNDPVVSNQTANAWKLFGRTAKFYAVPEDKPDLFTYYTDVYGPGPMILFRQVEVQSSRAQVIAALQSVLGSPRALSIDTLVAALQQHTGLDLTAYVAAWLKGTGTPAWPRFDLTYTSAPTTSSLLVHELAPSTPHKGCKFHIALHGANPTDVVTLAIDTISDPNPDQTLSVPTPAFAVTSLELDPQRECLVYLDASSPRYEPQPEPPWIAPRAAAALP